MAEQLPGDWEVGQKPTGVVSAQTEPVVVQREEAFSETKDFGARWLGSGQLLESCRQVGEVSLLSFVSHVEWLAAEHEPSASTRE